jgi:hypothetical protein
LLLAERSEMLENWRISTMNAMTRYAYDITLDGDGETFNHEGLTEWDTILDGPFLPDHLDRWLAENLDEYIDIDNRPMILNAVGCILHSDDNGSIDCEWFATQAEFDAARAEIEASYPNGDEAPDGWESVDTSVDELTEVSIPSEYIILAEKWYNGMGDMLYAVSSTGGLTLGSARPSVQVEHSWRALTDREWHLSLWSSLSSDIGAAARACEKSAHGPDHDDASELRQFERFADETIERLRKAYKLEDSDVV